jgi:hypothetical protein
MGIILETECCGGKNRTRENREVKKNKREINE